jgi:UDP-2-acetamido-3-amino-2,3-dideoxy-glucuronate N-acetyltransferase
MSNQWRDDPRFPGVRIHESSYVDEAVSIGEGTVIWHFCHILPEASLGRRCSLGQNVMVGPQAAIGDGCKIQNNVSLYQGVILEEEVFCGPSCVFTNVVNPRAFISRKQEFQETRVRRGATIGANATILCGNTIGRYAFVAAGAVVNAPVPDFALVAGVRLGADLVCPQDGSRYRENADGTLTCLDESGPAPSRRDAAAGS